MTWIFDPAPTGPSIPVAYLAGLAGGVVAATSLVVLGTSRLVQRTNLAELRNP